MWVLFKAMNKIKCYLVSKAKKTIDTIKSKSPSYPIDFQTLLLINLQKHHDRNISMVPPGILSGLIHSANRPYSPNKRNMIKEKANYNQKLDYPQRSPMEASKNSTHLNLIIRDKSYLI